MKPQKAAKTQGWQSNAAEYISPRKSKATISRWIKGKGLEKIKSPYSMLSTKSTK